MGSVRDCGSSTFPMLTQAAGGHAICRCPATSISARLREARARRLRFGNLADDMHLRGVDDAEQHASGGDVRAGRGVALSDHAADRRADDEQPFGIGGAAGARGVVLREAGLGRRQRGPSPAPPRLAPRPAASPGAAPARRQAFGPLAIARRQCQRRLRLRARPLQLRQIGRRRRRRQQTRELLPARHARAERARRRRASAGRRSARRHPRRRRAWLRCAPARGSTRGPPAPSRPRCRSPGSTAVPSGS